MIIRIEWRKYDDVNGKTYRVNESTTAIDGGECSEEEKSRWPPLYFLYIFWFDDCVKQREMNLQITKFIVFFFILSKRKSPKTTLNLLFYYNIKIIIKYRLYYFIKTNIKINQLRLSSTHLLGMIDSVKWKILYKYTS